MRCMSKLAFLLATLFFITACGGGGGGGAARSWKDDLNPLSVTSSDLRGVCSESPGTYDVTFSGTGILRINAVEPEVRINDAPVGIVSFNGSCVELIIGETDQVVEECTSFTVSIDTTGMEAGGVKVEVVNPEEVNTSVTTTDVFYIYDAPAITAVTPSSQCELVDSTMLTITGTNFTPMAEVALHLDTGEVVVPDTLDYISSTELQATFAGGIQASAYPEKHSVTVSNGEGCDTAEFEAFGVGKWPLVFFSDPPVIYNGISTDITIFTSDLGTNPATVELISIAGSSAELVFTNPDHPNKTVATVDMGLAAGTYDIRVTSVFECDGTLAGGLTASEDITLILASVEPQHVSVDDATAVTIYLEDPAATDPVFVEMPRAYLNPADGAGGATPLSAVVLPDPADHTILTAVIPKGMLPGLYDLIVVNPSGEIGILEVDRTADSVELGSGVVALEGGLPLVTKVSPGSFIDNSTINATINGENFDTGGVEVELTCRDQNGGVTVYPAVTVTPVTDTEIAATFDTTLPAEGDVCLVGVTNVADGARFDYSAVAVRGNSHNLPEWRESGAPMNVARRGLELSAARPTNTSRYLYAIGGDDGTDAGVYNDVEYINVSPFGLLAGSWAMTINSNPDLRDAANLTRTLPTGLSFFGDARVDDFIYLVGGFDGSINLGTLYRAKVLNPLESPEITGLDAKLGDPEATPPTGMDGGLWYYKVSAVFPSTDPNNPNGESLPGEVLVAQLPERYEGLVLTLEWTDVAGASGYRIYRTPQPDASVTDMQLLAQTSCGGVCECSATPENCRWTEEGTIVQTDTPDMSDYPLIVSALGNWHQPTIDNAGAAPVLMTSQRNGVATTVAPSPTDPNVYYLYAFGGVDGAGNAQNTYEWASITKNPDGSQTVSAFTEGTATIGSLGVRDANIWAVDSSDTDQLVEDAGVARVNIYLGGGVDSNGDDSTEVYSGYLDATSVGGELKGLKAEKNNTGARSGASVIEGNGYLYLFGGIRDQGGIQTNNSSAAVTYVVGPPPMNELSKWNSLGGSAVLINRAYAGTTEESAFFFIGGGLISDGLGGYVNTNNVQQNTK